MYVPGFTPELMRSNLGPSMVDPSEFAVPYGDRFSAAPTDAVASTASFAPSRKSGSKAFRPSLDPSLSFIDRDGQQGYYFVTNTGRAATTKANPTGFVSVNPNAQYRLVNERGKNAIVASGTGEQGLQSAFAVAQRLSAEQGKKANWKLEVLDPATGKWAVQADDDPKGNVLGKIADFALPIAASFIPGVGPVLGAALGSAASSVAQGRSLKDTLLRAGLTAGTAGLLDKTGASDAIGGALSSALGTSAASGAGGALAGSAAGAGILGAAGAQLAGLAPGIIVRGALNSGLSSALGGAAGAALGSAAGGALSGAVNGSPQTPDSRPVTEEGQIDVIGGRPTVSGGGGALPVGALLPASPPVSTPVTPVQTPDLSPEIVVERDRLPTGFDTPIPPLPLINTPATPVQTPNVQSPDGKGIDVIEALRAAGLLTGLLGGAVGGGAGTQGVIPPGFGLPIGTGGGLPAPNIPGLTPGTAGQRDMSGTDWYRYGYGPAQSFFNYVPQGAPNTSKAYTGYAEGGVAGVGTGRSDEIPALLSDGEYIIDAETVALLGDGSTKAGADRLDAFRVNIRKHKGQKLAKGDFSPDARDPMHYLKGGRT